MHVDISLLQTLCQNVSGLQRPNPGVPAPGHGDVYGHLSESHDNGNLTARDLDFQRERDRHAFLYIVVVLIFYSFGIIVAIIMYLKREKEDIVEEKAYDDFMNFRSDPDKRARYFRVQLMINQLNKVQRERDRRQCEEDQLESPVDGDPGSNNSISSSRSAEFLDIAVLHSGYEEGHSSLQPRQTHDQVEKKIDEKSGSDFGKHRSEATICERTVMDSRLSKKEKNKHYNTL